MSEPIYYKVVSAYLFNYAKLLEAEQFRLEVIAGPHEDTESLAEEITAVRRIANHLFENGWPKY